MMENFIRTTHTRQHTQVCGLFPSLPPSLPLSLSPFLPSSLPPFIPPPHLQRLQRNDLTATVPRGRGLGGRREGGRGGGRERGRGGGGGKGGEDHVSRIFPRRLFLLGEK